MNNYCVGNVLEISGNKIKVIMRQNTNLFTYFFNGVNYRGVTIDEYVGIIRGPYKIVAKVEKESLFDKLQNKDDHTYSLDRFQRIIEVKVIGYYYQNKFSFGIKYLPMIFNEVVLLSDLEINGIYSNLIKRTDKTNGCMQISIGTSLKENLPINLNIDNLFNTHIGIFGNTGSGKSNTLAKLYTELFNNNNLDVFGTSKFVLLDFNGEYVGDKLFTKRGNKTIINLKTNGDNGDKIKISPQKFWTCEILSVLFCATEKTQQPFIQNMLDFYITKDCLDEKGYVGDDTIKKALLQSVENLVEGNQKDMINIFKKILSILFPNSIYSQENFFKMCWHTTKTTIFYDNIYFNHDDGKKTAKNSIVKFIEDNWDSKYSLGIIDKVNILINAQLIYGLRYQHVQFEHISPLISRINSYKSFLEKTIEIQNSSYDKLTIISFKDCNQQAKQILPLLISKELYDNHILNCKDEDDKINRTCHLIIDEAHNILSEQLTREAESFKDYRLDVFEKIIKEGRKFGFYLTISSQRPYDISPTLVSQLHNHFIHRLVNDLDLKMIANTISSLDTISREQIPNLAPGQCILTGTSFEIPLLIQVKKLDCNLSPNSENADLTYLWLKNN